MDNWKENLGQALQKARRTVTNIFKKPLKRFIIILAIVAIIIISLGASYDALVDQFSENVSEHMERNPVKYDANGESILIEEEQIAFMEELLEDMGTSKEKLNLTTENLERIYAAEVVTQELNRGQVEEPGKYYGKIYVKKARESTEDLVDLTYVPLEEFEQMGADEIVNCFSIDEELDKLCVANVRIVVDDEGGETEQISIQKLDYKNTVLPYMMPVEFLLDLAIITNNPEFVMALADKVINETKIVIAVLEEQVTTETTTTNKYKLETKTEQRIDYFNEDGDYIDSTYTEPETTVSDEITETQTQTITTINPIIKIVSIKSWFIEQTYTYTRVTVESPPQVIGEDDPSNLLEDESMPNSNFELIDTIENADGSNDLIYESEVSRKIDQKRSVSITTTKITYQEGITKEPLDKAEEFLELLKTPFNKPGSSIKEAAIGKIENGAGILLQMLQNSERTQIVEHIMRYILYVYTGRNYGVTELDLNLFEANNFTTISNSSLSTYLRQFSHSGEAAQSADGKFYLMYGDGVGWPTIGNADLQWKSHYTKFNQAGTVLENGVEKTVSNVAEYVNGFLTKGVDAEYTNDEIYQMQIYIEKELVDRIGDSTQETYYNAVVNITSGLNLSRQQLYALTAIYYNRPEYLTKKINGRTFLEVYNEATALYEINSWEHNKYIWDNWWCALGRWSSRAYTS